MPQYLVAHPMASGQESLWLQCGPDSVDRDALAFQLASAQHKPHEFLLFFDGNRVVGRMRGEALTPKLYTIREINTHPNTPDEAVARALTSYLYHLFQADDIRILMWQESHTALVGTMLAQSGFVVHRTKQFVERRIDNYTSPYRSPFTYRTLADAGRQEFLDVMTEAAKGDPFPENEFDPEKEFDELVACYTGPTFDPANWRIAMLDGVAAGVVLPQPHDDAPQKGTLLYIAMLPAFRNRGLGKILHAAGMERLAYLGVHTYQGSTDARNTPMQTIFERNGCTTVGIQLFYRPVAAHSLV